MQKKNLRLLFVTQNDRLYLPQAFALICEALGKDIVAVVTAPVLSTHGGKLKGIFRHLRLFGLKCSMQLAARVAQSHLPTPLRHLLGWPGQFASFAEVAHFYGIPHYHVKNINSTEFANIARKHQATMLISLSCPQVVKRKTRALFPEGCINVHGAPLPRYRGLMPAFWQLRNNEKFAAVTVHDLTAGLDDGDIILQKKFEISPEDTWDSMVRKGKMIGAQALVEAVKLIRTGNATRIPNRKEDATYFSFPTGEDRKAFLAQGRRFF